jgi:uncharacterized repeat protein (TIGR01451 family)
MSDSPDPLYAGEALTYQLIISNTSSLDAPGVVVTDTLPVDVLPASVNSSQGDCSFFGGSVLCSLGNVPALSEASVTVVVTTTMDGVINNMVNIGSPGYDSNMSNNMAESATMVIPSADIRATAMGVPEALLPGGILVYNLSVVNQGPSEAQGVSLVDSLPDEVLFVGTDPETCSLNGSEVTCPLGNLDPFEETLVVITTTVEITETRMLTDSLFASSVSTHDPDLSNNTSMAYNLVDTTPPEISWERPVHNDDTYFTFGGMVTLEATATDNDQVQSVKFLLYDHVNSRWITLGIKYDRPYQVPFDSDMLQLNELYQVFAQGYDRVGNYNWERFFIQRIFTFNQYLPILNR